MSEHVRVTSSHYAGNKGEAYFEWQNKFGDRSGKINARKFTEFIDPEGDVLDFGCGSGHLLNAIKAKNKSGVEVNQAAIKYAESLGITVFKDITQVPTEFTEYVISNHALEHVPYPMESLKEIYRVMKQSGRLILCIPIDDWRKEKEFKISEINNHLHTWTPQLIGNLLVESGFDPEKLSIRVISHSWFRGTKYFWKNQVIFDVLCWSHSIITRNGRQIIVVAQK